MEQGDERVDVVALEGVDVPIHQLLLGVVERGRFGVGEVARGERRPGPLERAVHRCDGGVEERGDLVGLPVQHLAQDQHGPLPGRQLLQGGDEGEADRLPGDRHLGRVVVGAEDAAVGDRLQPAVLGQGVAGTGRCRHGRPEIHRAGPPLASAEEVEADVGGDAVEPGAQRRPSLEAIDAAPRPDQRLLGGVLGLERRAQHAVAVAGELDPVLLELAFDSGPSRPQRCGSSDRWWRCGASLAPYPEGARTDTGGCGPGPQAYDRRMTATAEQPRWRGINHLALVTSDMDATVRFYHGVLGARLVATIGTASFRHYFFEVGAQNTIAFFEYADADLARFAKPAGVPDRRAIQFDHLSLNLPDERALESLRARLKEAGCEVTDVVDHGFMRSIYFTDPNGIALEASWWVDDATGRDADYRDDGLFADRQPGAGGARIDGDGSARLHPDDPARPGSDRHPRSRVATR